MPEKMHMTLSELAARESPTLVFFRVVLWVCGPLFLLTIAFYIAPQVYTSWLVPVWTLTVICEILLGVFSPRGKAMTVLHEGLAYTMAIGMLVTAMLFAASLAKYAQVELMLLLAMLILSMAAAADRKRFIFYELGFIFTSHSTILVAVLSLL